MEVCFQTGGFANWKADVLLLPLPEKIDLLSAHPDLDKACPWISIAPAMRDVSAQKNDLTLVHGHPELNLSRLLFVGLGPQEKFSLGLWRKAIAKAVQYCRQHKFLNLLLPIPLLVNLTGGKEILIREAVYGALLSLYDGGLFKKKDPSSPKDPTSFTLGLSEDKVPQTIETAALQGQHAAEAVKLTRVLVNTPANLLTPEDFASKAKQLAKEVGFSCKILNEQNLSQENMGAFLAVGQGSVHPPRLIVLEYAAPEHEQDNPLILVGKGLCFDSGGISLKPAGNMHHMKGDMAGAAAVLGAISACAKDKLPKHVIGLLACAENLPDGKAVKPGDVVRGLRGDTIEITNTDAEGRLVLADTLAYAQKYYNPAAIVDIATLTGACSIALGDELAGLFCDHATLTQHLNAAGQVGNEHFWPMPLWKNYTKKLKSEVADICHIGTREGGAITAALFLNYFVDPKVPWAHLDIAGVDWIEKKNPLCPKGGTGFGCRTLLELIRGGWA